MIEEVAMAKEFASMEKGVARISIIEFVSMSKGAPSQGYQKVVVSHVLRYQHGIDGCELRSTTTEIYIFILDREC